MFRMITCIKGAFIFPFFFLSLSETPVYTQFGGGGGGGDGGNISRILSAASVTHLASEAPAPWENYSETVPGLIVEDVMQGPDFFQGKVNIRQDIGVWVTSFDGVHADDLERAEDDEELFIGPRGSFSHSCDFWGRRNHLLGGS